jgi:hypothetical protein
MLEPVFNELSAEPPALDLAVAFDRMFRFVEVLRAAPDHGLDPGLRIPQTFHGQALCSDYHIWDRLNDTRVPREQRIFLLALATKSPYLDQTPEAVQERALLVELRFGEGGSDGLRAAYLLEVPLLSFLQVPWDAALIDCECEELIDDTMAPTHQVRLPNIAEVAHLGIHADWIRWRKRRSIVSPADLWERRNSLFPHLVFCPSVMDQLMVLRPTEPRFQQAVNKLFDLDDYFADWSTGGFDPGAFPKCNPASPETLARFPMDYQFSAEDGRHVVASWHLYLTPGKGRLYFEADGATRRGIVCHVGDKLPDTTYGRT